MARPGLVHMLKDRKPPSGYIVRRKEECGFDAISISGNTGCLWSTVAGMRLTITERGRESNSRIEMSRYYTEYITRSTEPLFYRFTNDGVIKCIGYDRPGVQITIEQYLEEINQLYREMLNFCRDG